MKKIFAGIIATMLLTIGLIGIASPAQAVTGCANNKLCFYTTTLEVPAGPAYTVSSTTTSCVNIFSQHIGVFSVVNNTSYRFKVYHSSNCGTVGSYFYAESSGNMNWEWLGDGIGSVKRG